jgi:tetratricopeptide (TPR) repeat protein
MHTDPLDGSAMAQRGYISKTLAQVAESRHRKAERDKYYDEATRLFEQAARLNPKDASAQNGLGNVHHARGNLDDAISAYQRAINLAPKYTAAHHDLALAFEDKAKIEAEPSARRQCREKALEAWEEAYRLAPGDPGFSADDVLAIGQHIEELRRQHDG